MLYTFLKHISALYTKGLGQNNSWFIVVIMFKSCHQMIQHLYLSWNWKTWKYFCVLQGVTAALPPTWIDMENLRNMKTQGVCVECCLVINQSDLLFFFLNIPIPVTMHLHYVNITNSSVQKRKQHSPAPSCVSTKVDQSKGKIGFTDGDRHPDHRYWSHIANRHT